MRKLKLQMQISVDGFVSTGPNDEQKWVTWAWEEIRPHVIALAESCDTILIGRKLAVDYIPYWESVFTNPDDPMHEVSRLVTSMTKVLFTKTLDKAEWPNTILAKGDLVQEVKKLKSQSGKDIIVYGGSSFVSNLVREGLIEEYHLFVNPVALGKGEPIFDKLKDVHQLQLKNTIVYPCGIVMMHYEPK